MISILRKTPQPGDRVWFRDPFGIPSAATVDRFSETKLEIHAVSGRGGFVVGKLAEFYRSLEECASENRILGRV